MGFEIRLEWAEGIGENMGTGHWRVSVFDRENDHTEVFTMNALIDLEEELAKRDYIVFEDTEYAPELQRALNARYNR